MTAPLTALATPAGLDSPGPAPTLSGIARQRDAQAIALSNHYALQNQEAIPREAGQSPPTSTDFTSPPAISIRGLTKRYGSLAALNDLNLDINRGEIFGFLGLNGAGKTTTIRLLLDLLRPTSGNAFIFGYDCWTQGLEARARLGYLPGELGLYLDLTGLETLDFLAGLNRQPVDKRHRQELCDRLELPRSDLRRRLREYSTGMKRKLGIIQAFQANPPLLILDEPTEGLDPLMQESFYGPARRRGSQILPRGGVMRGAFLLFRLSLKRVWMLLCATGLLLAGFQLLRVYIAASVHEAGEFGQIAALLPPSVRAILGPSLASVMSFDGLVCGGFYDLGIVIALVALAIALATLPASEIETGFADLILARPMPRHWLITRTIALVLFSILLMLFMIMVGTRGGLALFAPAGVSGPPARQTASLALNLGLLLLCWSGIAMAFGAARRRGVAGPAMSLLAFAALLLDYAQKLWPPLEWIGWLSPFRYFTPFELVMGDPLPVENLLVLGAIALTGYTLAYFIISQRDISR